MHAPGFLKNRKLLAAAGLVALLLSLALWPSAVAVDLSTVERGPLRVTVDEEGETRVRERFVVSAPVAGRVLRIELEPGDPVAHGKTVVAQFLPGDPTPLDARSRAEAEESVSAARAALGRAKAEQQRAQAALAYARSEHQRLAELEQQHVASRQQLDAAETEERQARETLQAAEFAAAGAEHELRMAEARLISRSSASRGRAIEIRSPIDGVVLKRLRESEAVVPAGEPLLELGDPTDIEVISDLLSTDAVRVKPGASVVIEQFGADRSLGGRVRRVEPSGFMKISALGVEEQRVNVLVDFEDRKAASDALGDGYRVEIRIVVWQAPDALKLPSGSLFRRGSDWCVFSVEGGRARLRQVVLGQRNGLEAQVLSGLAEGAKVVVHPSDTLEDGSRVTARPAR